MKKFFLVAFILLDLALMGASVFVLYLYLGRHGVRLTPGVAPAVSSPEASRPAAGPAVTPSTPPAPGGPLLGGASPPAEPGTRKILFSYRNSKVKQASIRADFTGWKAEPMRKEASGVWTYQANLTPGEYAYCYTADDRTFKDPANKRTKQIGRTFVSAIVVEPR